jgi:hypothetical protein
MVIDSQGTSRFFINMFYFVKFLVVVHSQLLKVASFLHKYVFIKAYSRANSNDLAICVARGREGDMKK